MQGKNCILQILVALKLDHIQPCIPTVAARYVTTMGVTVIVIQEHILYLLDVNVRIDSLKPVGGQLLRPADGILACCKEGRMILGDDYLPKPKGCRIDGNLMYRPLELVNDRLASDTTHLRVDWPQG